MLVCFLVEAHKSLLDHLIAMHEQYITSPGRHNVVASIGGGEVLFRAKFRSLLPPGSVFRLEYYKQTRLGRLSACFAGTSTRLGGYYFSPGRGAFQQNGFCCGAA